MDVLAHHALAALAAACRRIADESGVDDAIQELTAAAALAANAEVAVIRLADPSGDLRVRAVSTRSEAQGAELEGSRFTAGELPREEVADPERLPDAVRTVAGRMHADAIVLLPVWVGGRPVASLELMRAGDPFELGELTLARVAAAQLGLALLGPESRNGEASAGAAERLLELSGDALAAVNNPSRVAEQVVGLAAGATSAVAGQLWRLADDGRLELRASTGSFDGRSEEAAAFAALQALTEQGPVTLQHGDPLPPASSLATVRLGHPPVGVLQLLFATQAPPPVALIEQLATFGVRAAQALRAGERALATEGELERAQALLAVVGQAIAQLSLSHTLETAADRIAELLRMDRLAVYLHDQGRLHSALERELAGPHATVAERLLELALGPFRAQGMVHVTDAAADLRLVSVQEAVHEAEIEAALAVPLIVREELIGLVVVYLPRGHELTEHERALLAALASQLAVAVQNATLHEDVQRLAAERERALDAEAARGRQLSALHEITSSFATSLSLEATLDAVVRAAVDLLGVDAAVIRMLDSRGTQLVPRASHFADQRQVEALRPLLERPQSADRLPGRRLFRTGRALVLDPESAARLGASYELLVPFLEQGSTAVVIPIATPTELLATLTIVSLDPSRRIEGQFVETALTVAGQAALAIANARLYQHEKYFADTMQRSLLPLQLPAVHGLEIGAVYESSSRVEVGGDVYDFLSLPGGGFAAILGDVSGHGIEATADMALAKFVFRSLAREHPEPGEFLASANDVVHQELAGGKFITMLYLAFDPDRSEVAAAGAGHPPARLVAPDGSVSELAPAGLALGVDSGQHYEEVRAELPSGAAVCLYTDGIVEARRDDEQFGEARLDATLVASRELHAQELAERVVAECRRFAGEDLADDCAVVVIKKT